jgi:hypothetical protein
VLSVEDWAEIRRLHRAEGLSIKMITRVMGVSRNTVRAAVASDVPPKYERRPAGSIVDEFEPRIRELLRAFPTMPATVIAERVGWTRDKRVLAARVRQLRPVYLPPEPAGRTSYLPREIAQCRFPCDEGVTFSTDSAERTQAVDVVQAALRYSWMMPPSTSTRSTRVGGWLRAGTGLSPAAAGGCSAIPRPLGFCSGSSPRSGSRRSVRCWPHGVRGQLPGPAVNPMWMVKLVDHETTLGATGSTSPSRCRPVRPCCSGRCCWPGY